MIVNSPPPISKEIQAIRLLTEDVRKSAFRAVGDNTNSTPAYSCWFAFAVLTVRKVKLSTTYWTVFLDRLLHA